MITNKNNDATIGKKIRSLRLDSGMTQEELAKNLNVTRQALSNWERNINEPDINVLKQLCSTFGLKMDELVLDTMKMENIKNDEEDFSKYDMVIGLFYAVGLFLGLGTFFVGGLLFMTKEGWACSLFVGITIFLVFGLASHAIITLKRNNH